MAGTHEVFWTRVALDDLKKIVTWIGADSKSRARDVSNSIRNKAARLGEMPLQGRVVPELRDLKVELYRELIESPWRIVYKVNGSSVFILAVFDGRRNIEEVLIDRFM